jgi:hypothetical protein
MIFMFCIICETDNFLGEMNQQNISNDAMVTENTHWEEGHHAVSDESNFRLYRFNDMPTVYEAQTHPYQFLKNSLS